MSAADAGANDGRPATCSTQALGRAPPVRPPGPIGSLADAGCLDDVHMASFTASAHG